jgi:hypothetical protein
MIKTIAALIALLAIACATATSAQTQPTNTRTDVDKHTRAYVKQVRGCMAIATLSVQVASKGQAQSGDVLVPDRDQRDQRAPSRLRPAEDLIRGVHGLTRQHRRYLLSR